MVEKALGLIEVNGALGAIVAADAALKAAKVSLLNVETVKAGIRTVQLIGDVSAVRAAVDAAVEAVQDQPYYLTSHVISRLDDQTCILFPAYDKQVEETKLEEMVNTLPAEKAGDVSHEISQVELSTSSKKYLREDLEKMKVVDLRKLAYREETVSLTKKEIKFANKLRLIEALTSL